MPRTPGWGSPRALGWCRPRGSFLAPVGGRGDRPLTAHRRRPAEARRYARRVVHPNVVGTVTPVRRRERLATSDELRGAQRPRLVLDIGPQQQIPRPEV